MPYDLLNRKAIAMRRPPSPCVIAAFLGLLIALPCCAEVSGQVVDNLGFKALPRPINYATPLSPAGSIKAVIVYGKDAPWTRKAAEAVQKAVQDWSGVKLELADDRTVTADETWLLSDAYRKTPLIVLGNAKDNRVVHALGTRFLAQSSRHWPGGDRYTIRSIFEPFVADVNYIAMEASTEAGLDAAAAKFAELLKTFPKDAAATIPRVRVLGCVKDQWGGPTDPWKPNKEWFPTLQGSVTDIAKHTKARPSPPATACPRRALATSPATQLAGGAATPARLRKPCWTSRR